jgi:hypothetical protein
MCKSPGNPDGKPVGTARQLWMPGVPPLHAVRFSTASTSGDKLSVVLKAASRRDLQRYPQFHSHYYYYGLYPFFKTRYINRLRHSDISQ